LYRDGAFRLLWRRGGACVAQDSDDFINPFAVDAIEAAVSWDFTEALPQACASLQWAIWQPARRFIDPKRGNQATAAPTDPPAGDKDVDSLGGPSPLRLTEAQRLVFVEVRAYPDPQYDRVCEVLHNRSLPLEHPAVYTLLTQTLFHIGEIPSLPRKLVQLQNSQAVEAELRDLVDTVRNTRGDHPALMLVGQLAAFLAQFRPSCRAVAREVSRAAQHLAAALEEEA
jgi:hypothetical protein